MLAQFDAFSVAYVSYKRYLRILLFMKINFRYFQNILNSQMAEPNIDPIDYIVDDVGKHVKASKKRYLWIFAIGGKKNQLVCDMSLISGKVQLSVNRKVIYTSQMIVGSVFQHSFVLDGCQCLVLQQGECIELRINNKAYLHLLNQTKTKKQFKNHEDAELKDFVYEQKDTSDKKMKLNISAMSGMKKKKDIESQNWKDMGNIHSSIPNFFQPDNDAKTEQLESKPQPSKNNQIKTSLATDLLNEQPPQNMNVVNMSEEKSAINLMEDFNTMQQMFATQINHPTITQQSVPSQQPQQFSTMQALFATKVPVPQVNESKIAVVEPMENSNNSLQELLKTEKISPINAEDFNTMRNMFQTIAPNPTPVNLSEYKPIDLTQIPNENDFNTMQSMFKTVNLNETPKTTHQKPSQESVQESFVPNPAEFSTIQNLFKTQNVNMMPEMQNLQALNDIGNINASDFNTIQNLFKTNAHGTDKTQQPVNENSLL